MRSFTRLSTFAVSVVAGALLLTACGGSHDMSDMDMVTPSGTTGATAEDAMFAQMMIPHHEQAVVMATLAETRAASPEIVDLAAEIKAAQQPEIDQMTAWLEEWGVPVMSGDEAMGDHGGHGMSGMLTQDQLGQLEDASGPEFDRLFAEFMIEHHVGAIDMSEDVVNSQDSRVAALATEIITTQQVEIDQLRAFLERQGHAAEGDASASPSLIALSTPLDHVHAAVYIDGRLLIGTHTGVTEIDPVSGVVVKRGASQDDFMGLAGSAELLVASGHPGMGSALPDPVGLLRSTDGAQTWETVSLTGEIDFHALAIDGDRVAGAATTGELMYSADGGVNWEGMGVAEVLSLAWFDDQLWTSDGQAMMMWTPGDSMGHGEGMPHSMDGGRGALLAASPDGSRLWTLRADGTVAHSVDGEVWVEAGSVTEAAALAASEDAAYVVTPDRIQVIPAVA
jgi:uncharacterized protein (DUF305 family)